jgi:hypothetical protein
MHVLTPLLFSQSHMYSPRSTVLFTLAHETRTMSDDHVLHCTQSPEQGARGKGESYDDVLEAFFVESMDVNPNVLSKCARRSVVE